MPSFGEFALDLSAAGLWPSGGACTAYTSDFVFSRTGNSTTAELQDFVGFALLGLTQCGTLIIRKVTAPATPDPAQTFGYRVARQGRDAVVDGEVQVTGRLPCPAPRQTPSRVSSPATTTC